MKQIEHSVIFDQNARPEWILNILNSHFHGTEENKHTFFEVIFKSETFVIARLDIDIYAVVVNGFKMFLPSLNAVSNAIFNYEK